MMMMMMIIAMVDNNDNQDENKLLTHDIMCKRIFFPNINYLL